MTRVQREPSGTIIVGSFNDDRSYALMFASGDQGDSNTDTSGKMPVTCPSSPPSHGVVNPAVTVVSSMAEELQHASEMSNPESVTHSQGSNHSCNSTVRVDITDIEEESYNFTTSTLRKCKHQVLKPYWALLMFIGWRVFRHDVIHPRSLKYRILNLVYPTLIILLLMYTYTYEMIACEWKLDVTQDILILPSKAPTVPPSNTTFTTDSIPDIPMGPAIIIINKTATPTTTPPQPCEHIVTTYLIPNILHFIAYVMGLYYFRIQDNEQMYAMMEKVFLQANPIQGGSSSQQKLVTKIRVFLACGSVWVLMTLVLQALYVWAFNFPRLEIFITYGLTFHWVTFSIELLGRVVFNSVIVAVVVNYVTQCQMVMSYVKGITLRLQEKSSDIKNAFKDILLLRQSLSLLNGIIAKMTSLVMVILAELTVIGVSILALNEYDVAKVWVYRSIFPCVWVIMLAFPLIQASRVNSVCLRLKKISLEMRVFGYKSSSLLELDSFLQFVHCTRLKAKLFHIPILPSYIIAFTILACFIFLILIQTSIVGPKNYIV
ncbi:hypothetical protein BaRGS_00033259 [Batillaria attramentaria]|uniref:Gustatory receptor n=1 Tax=Batillaria attramentaria TaxID=370345 RepID=A0ABD0JL39_9CAEN